MDPIETEIVDRDHLVERLRNLKEVEGFDMLTDLAGVDYKGFSGNRARSERFEVVYHLLSVTDGRRHRVRVPVPESDPSIATVTSLWSAADWFERECFDMFGIKFEGHPNLKRLLMYEGFEGHPLRKDYPITKRQKIPVPEEAL